MGMPTAMENNTGVFWSVPANMLFLSQFPFLIFLYLISTANAQHNDWSRECTRAVLDKTWFGIHSLVFFSGFSFPVHKQERAWMPVSVQRVPPLSRGDVRASAYTEQLCYVGEAGRKPSEGGFSCASAGGLLRRPLPVNLGALLRAQQSQGLAVASGASLTTQATLFLPGQSQWRVPSPLPGPWSTARGGGRTTPLFRRPRALEPPVALGTRPWPLLGNARTRQGKARGRAH